MPTTPCINENPDTLPTYDKSVPLSVFRNGVYVYPHGYDLRVRLLIPGDESCKTLSILGWKPEEPSGDWLVQGRKTGKQGVLDGGKPFGKIPNAPKAKKKKTAVQATDKQKGRMRGVTSLGGRRPQKKSSVLTRNNKRWGTRLYGLGIEMVGDTVFLDIKGVRFQDVETLMESELRLRPSDYQIEYFTRCAGRARMN